MKFSYSEIMAWEEFQKGGTGSGNFGHEGRPGEVGGSGEGGGEGSPDWSTLMNTSAPILDKTLKKYKMDSSEAFETANYSLYRADGKLGYITDKNTRGMVRDLDTAFSSAPTIGQDVVLYRGITEKISVKETYVDRGFAMTTVDPKEAMDYALLGDKEHTVFEISVPKNAKVIVNSKNEVVLPRDSKYTITGSETKDGVNFVKLTWKSISYD